MYLLAPLIVRNFKKIFGVEQELQRQMIFGTKLTKELFWNMLVDIDGSVELLKMKSLKPKCGSGNIIDDTLKHFPEDIGGFNLWNIIAEPLVVTPKGSTQFEVNNYENVVEIFNQVKKLIENHCL